jgi:dTDP-glucose pyrophosphorylase
MSRSKLQGVILAAGHGSRMGPFGSQYPKPIAPVCNRPLLAYQIDQMKVAGINEIIILIGHLGHRIQSVLGDGSKFGVKIQYVEQEQRLGLAHAVGQLEPFIRGSFLLMLGDIFFDVDGLDSMVEAFNADDPAAVLAVKEESDVEAIKRNFAVLLGDDGNVKRVIEKPRQVPNRLKGCGIYLFDERIFEAVRRTPRTAMRDEYELTDSIQILIDYDYPVKAVEAVQWDINVTFIGDLIRCCQHEMVKQNQTSIVGEDTNLHDGVELMDSVVGDGVTISGPIRLERCVVLEGVTLENPPEMICDSVITSDGILPANPE